MRRNRFGELTDDSPERNLAPIVDVEERIETDEADANVLRRMEVLRFDGLESPARMRSEPGEPLPKPVEPCEDESELEALPERTDGVPKQETGETPFLRTGEPTDFDRGELRNIERTLAAGEIFAACDNEDGYRLEALEADEPANGLRYRAVRAFRAIEERVDGEVRTRYRTALSLAELIELGVLERLDGSGAERGEEANG